MVMKRVREMHQLSEDVRNISREIDNIMNEIRTCWHGQAANTYLQKCMELQSKISELCSSMQETSYTIGSIATTIKAVDDKLASIKLQT